MLRVLLCRWTTFGLRINTRIPELVRIPEFCSQVGAAGTLTFHVNIQLCLKDRKELTLQRYAYIYIYIYIHTHTHTHTHTYTYIYNIHIVVVQSLSYIGLSVTPWLQYARLPCPSHSHRVYSNTHPLSRWGHPTISFCCPLLLLPSISEKSEVKVIQSCPTPHDPMDSEVHGILQARILEWVAFLFSRGSSQPRDWTQVSHMAGGFFTSWATRETQEYWSV